MAINQSPQGDNPSSTESLPDDIKLECINDHRWRAGNVTRCPVCESRYIYQIENGKRTPATK